MSQKQLSALNLKLEKIFKDNSKTRRTYNRQYGQVFIFDTDLAKGILTALLEEAKIEKPESIASRLVAKMKKSLEKESSYGKKSYGMLRAKEYAERIKTGQVPTIRLTPSQLAYPVRSYNTVNEIKLNTGKLLERYTSRVGKSTIQSSRFTGSDNKSGIQLGHGELSASVSLVKTLKIEQMLSRFGSNSDQLLKGIQEIKDKYNEEFDFKIALQHKQVLSARGTFKKGYTAVFSSQATLENQMDAVHEKAFLSEIQDYITENVFTLEASPSLKDGITSVLLSNFTGKKRLKVKSDIKPKKVRSNSTKKTHKSKITQSQPSVRKGGIVTKSKKSAKKGVASSPLYLIGILNQQLPQVVAKNMETPALNYQTGRFASGVKVTDIVMTPQGFPSIGYTYDKYPYQTFEPGFKQGDPDRDPRKLINRSIREIAAQYAIGRFYTRRV